MKSSGGKPLCNEAQQESEEHTELLGQPCSSLEKKNYAKTNLNSPCTEQVSARRLRL